MKKYLFSILALVLGMGMLQANPVGLSTAKMIGQQYVQNTFETRSNDLELVYTGTSDRGEVVFYVFNVGKEGFVIVSANDYFRPIVGFSEEGPFDLNNSNLAFYLDKVVRGRSNRNLGQATPEVAAERNRVMSYGSMFSKMGGRGQFYLCTTKWNQDYPYNYYCPTNQAGPGGRVYAGCVATAMAQVMKFWNHPTQGQGQHTYNYGGSWSANFGATTYDWENMPNSISSSSPQVQIDAVATLIYHCAVSMNMQWSVNGSGAYSAEVPSAISSYFKYTNAAVYQNRDNFSYTNWKSKLVESFDMGWPLYYSGQSSDGGHAFVCDGYNDEGLFHFNFGWSGSGDGFFDFDEIDYNSSDGAVFNYVPAEVYNNTAAAPTNLTVTPAPNNALSATLTWTNPSKYANNSTMSSIDQIIIKRGAELVTIIDNPAPGASMTYVDNSVPRFDQFTYNVYAVCSGRHGKICYSTPVSFGPTCDWTIMMNSSAFQGWRGGYVSVFNASGTEIAQATTNGSGVSSATIAMPLGAVSFAWTAPAQEVSSMGITIKNSQNTTVYTFSGNSNDMAEGMFFSTNNSCGGSTGTGIPSNMVAVTDENAIDNINVSWEGVNENGYGYTIYRDGLLYRLIPDATSFVDENVPDGGHCYYAGFLSDGGENNGYSNESCANAGDGCEAPTNVDYELNNNMKPIVKWEKPENTDGLSGFLIFRKYEDGEYARIKITSATTVSFKDNSVNAEGNYYYKVYAYYQDTDCTSAPANYKWADNQYYLHVYYSTTDVNEMSAGIQLFPNPTKGSFTIEGVNLQNVSVYNALGQMVYTSECEGNSTVIDLNDAETGIYMVKIVSANGETVKKVSVIR